MERTRTPTSRARTSRDGLTLLELLVVVALLAMLALASSLALPRQDRDAVDTTAERLAAFLAEVRRASLRSRRPVVVTMADGSGTVVADDGRQFDLPGRLRAALFHDRDDFSTRAFVAFFPDGSSSGGHFELSDGEQVASIGVRRLTGKAWLDR